MHPYHNQIKKRIKNNELVGYEFVDDYPGIGKALVLYFSTNPYKWPVRPEKYVEYVDVLAKWNLLHKEKEATA